MNKRILGVISAVLFTMTNITVYAVGTADSTTINKNGTKTTITTTTTTSKTTTTSTDSKDSQEIIIMTNPDGTPVVSSVPSVAWKHESRTFTFEESKAYTSYYDIGLGKIVKDNNVFPKTYHIDEDGYLGDIPLDKVTWNDNLITNRKEEISKTETVTVEQGQPVPETKTIEVTDPKTNKKVAVQLKKKSASKISDKTETVYTQDTGFFRWLSNYSDSYPGNDGSSSSKDSKWSSYSDAPDDNTSYYGSLYPGDRGKDKYHNYKSSNIWAWSSVYYAKDAKDQGVDSRVAYDKKGDFYYFVGDSTVVENRYGKGVTQPYSFPDGNKTYVTYTVVYQGTAYYEDYIASSRGTAYYKGTLTKSVAVLDGTIVDDNIGEEKVVK